MPPFPSGEISLAPCAPALSLPADEAIANTAIATDITRQFIRAKRPCADGYRWYLRTPKRMLNAYPAWRAKWVTDKTSKP